MAEMTVAPRLQRGVLQVPKYEVQYIDKEVVKHEIRYIEKLVEVPISCGGLALGTVPRGSLPVFVEKQRRNL